MHAIKNSASMAIANWHLLTPIWRFSASVFCNAALLDTNIFAVLFAKQTAITLFIHDIEFCLVKKSPPPINILNIRF